MTRDEILDVIREYKQKYGEKFLIREIGVFGPAVKNQMKEFHDIGIVVKMERPDSFRLVRVKLELEGMMHRRVDIVAYMDGMDELLKERIDGEAVYA